MFQIGRILIAGTNSGSGKTTVTLAILSALKKRGLHIASFKCGPDYIDPLFHRQALGIPSYNLDPYFLNNSGLNRLLSNYSCSEILIIEGVMGYYDGISTTTEASTYDVAKKTQTPVILVMNTKGMCASAGAVMKGFKDFMPNSNIKGVIFNRLNPSMYPYMSNIACENGLIPLGFLPQCDSLSIPSRNLGLYTDISNNKLSKIFDELSNLAAENLDLDSILNLAETAPSLSETNNYFQKKTSAKLALSKDEAFCFIYEENIDLLKSLGFEIEFFSPLHDSQLPNNYDALWICGGYPEAYSKELSTNKKMLSSLKSAIQHRMPTIAECGGFMYLHRKMDGHDMVGVIDAESSETKRLQRFGYINLTAEHDNLLCKKGESIRAHEFHYWTSSDYGDSFIAKKAGKNLSYPCIHASETMYAGFPHLYLPANPSFAHNFFNKALKYKNN